MATGNLEQKVTTNRILAVDALIREGKYPWPDVGRAKMSLEKRYLIEGEVTRLHRLTGINVLILVLFTGVSGRTWREWQGQETRHNGHIPRAHWVTTVSYLEAERKKPNMPGRRG